jgi:uncharacterized protein
MKVLHWLSFILVIVGALNWGLVGIWDFDLVAYLLGNYALVQQIVYILVGVAGLGMLLTGLLGKCHCSHE